MLTTERVPAGQAIGGLVWSLFAGQPLVVIATTALVSLYSKVNRLVPSNDYLTAVHQVVYDMAIVLNEDFYTVYAWVGLWNTLFVMIYSFCGLSNIIKFSTRSVEEVDYVGSLG